MALIGAKKSKLGKFRIPWFMLDLGNFTLITLPNVPLEVNSSKVINWAKIKVPGREFEPMQFSNMGAQEISFSIKVINRSWVYGNLPMLKLFENLRTPVEGLLTMLFSKLNNANPKVLFWYGTGNTIPLIYYVEQCDFKHILFNKLGYPTVTDVDMKLVLDEDTILYKAEKIARMVLTFAGMAEAVFQVVKSFLGEKPY